MSEAHQIAARLAVASQLFALPHNDINGRAVRDTTVYAEADGDVITITSTDHFGRTREYRAEIRLVAGHPEKQKVPVSPCAATQDGDRLTDPQQSEESR